MDPALIDQHWAEIVDDFLSRLIRAECSCGWIGDYVATQRDALADHAAHVHVVAGLAVEGDKNDE